MLVKSACVSNLQLSSMIELLKVRRVDELSLDDVTENGNGRPEMIRILVAKRKSIGSAVTYFFTGDVDFLDKL
jgi:predicted RNase H-like nuclease (RuvC/YqgF family)